MSPAPEGTVGLSGLTMGIVGLGSIGRAIAERARGFAMRVIAVDAHELPRPDYVAELGLLDGMPDLLRRADVVAVATPITDRTRGMLGARELALLKPSAYLLVMSRGGIVDEPTVRAHAAGGLAGRGGAGRHRGGTSARRQRSCGMLRTSSSLRTARRSPNRPTPRSRPFCAAI